MDRGHIIDGNSDKPLLLQIFSGTGIRTRISIQMKLILLVGLTGFVRFETVSIGIKESLTIHLSKRRTAGQK
jgi:hypothetical protein